MQKLENIMFYKKKVSWIDSAEIKLENFLNQKSLENNSACDGKTSVLEEGNIRLE